MLYIDDLDRCTPERVVAVLEAVHLLLAFPLFVVVVAVDPRWLRRSLEKVYPDLLGRSEVAAGEGETTLRSTPQDYLEKIFQIPLYLRPIGEDGYRGLIGALAGSDVLPPEDMGAEAAERQGGAAKLPFAEGVGEGELFVGEEEPLDPEQLRFRPWELEDMQRLAGLFRTPRAVKRFVNTYRLVRALVKQTELEEFEGTAAEPGTYRWAMLLLAVMAGYPNVALRFVQHLGEAEPSSDFRAFTARAFAPPAAVASPAAPPAERSKARGSRPKRAPPPVAAAVDPFAAEWAALGRALETVDAPQTVSELLPWLQRVVRFSFVPGALQAR